MKKWIIHHQEDTVLLASMCIRDKEQLLSPKMGQYEEIKKKSVLQSSVFEQFYLGKQQGSFP
jgi:hypothetical protein